MMNKLKIFFRMIKIEHSVFALPFAYIGLFWAAKGWPGWTKFLFLTIAMVAVRSFAMTVNRIVDFKIDAKNPRTQDRPLVRGDLSLRECYYFLCGSVVIFCLACAGLNKLCLFLSPLALVWSVFYSYTKRFTWGCHFILGSVLGLAPVAGWIAYSPFFSLPSILIGCGVMFWVAGFDILYASQDVEFDKKEGLFSIPAVFGLEAGFAFSKLSHFLCILFFVLAGFAFNTGVFYYIFLLIIAIILLLEHRVVSPQDLSKINLAFFTLNGFISILLFVGVLLDLFLKY